MGDALWVKLKHTKIWMFGKKRCNALRITNEEEAMNKKINLSTKYATSEDVVARDVQGEFIIIPITSGVGGQEDEIFTMNETGRAIWDKLDGKRTLKDVVEDLNSEFEGKLGDIQRDVLGIVRELLKRKMVVGV